MEKVKKIGMKNKKRTFIPNHIFIKLSAWEKQFIISINSNSKSLSKKQSSILNDIKLKYNVIKKLDNVIYLPCEFDGWTQTISTRKFRKNKAIGKKYK
jgi:hypothetical protein